MKSATVSDLVRQLKKRLDLECKAGGQGDQRSIQPSKKEGAPTRALIGHLNFIHPNRIQVLGKRELEYIESLGKNSRSDMLLQLFSHDTTAMVIIANGNHLPNDFLLASDKEQIPLYTTMADSQEIISHFQYLLGNILADSIIIHGVFMEVIGIGVLLTGDSGIGKSELALDLISRGHRLIADDAPEFSRIAPDIINGTCPALLREFLEVRGLGILNIRSIFGDSAVKTSKYLHLIIDLESMTDEQLYNVDRLRGERRTRSIFNLDIPEFTLPVAPGRNLAVAVEAAVRNHILLQKGYDAAEDFIQRQHQLVQKSLQ